MGQAKQKQGLPSLRDWLASMTVSVDADQRDAYADFAEWVAGMLQQQEAGANPRDAMFLRMIKSTSLAIVETCNDEQRRGAETPEVMAVMCRSLGLSFGYAMMSLSWKDDAPIRKMSKPLTSEFESGLKFAIDECMAQMAPTTPGAAR